MFVDKFDSFVMEGATITLGIDGFSVVAIIERDDDLTSPDNRQDGYWPSLDPDDNGYIGDKSEAELAAATAKAQSVLDAWENDEWFYCGVCLVVSRNGCILTERYAHALWGVECNLPGTDNSYLTEVANRLLPEALDDARAKLATLCGRSTRTATPGTWIAEEPLTPGASITVWTAKDDEGHRMPIAHVRGGNTANAALIEAAPTMRELLADLVEWAAYMGGFDDRKWTEAESLLNRLRDAGA